MSVALYAFCGAAIGPDHPWVGGFFALVAAYRAWRLYRDW